MKKLFMQWFLIAAALALISCNPASAGGMYQNASVERIKADVTAAATAAAISPAGAVVFMASATCPNGYLLADGGALATSGYAALFAAMGYTFGGSGASFNKPDLRGEFIRGLDSGRGVDAGRTLGSAQAQSVQAHTHTIPVVNSASDGAGDARLSAAGANGTRASGSYGSAETRPRNIALLPCIKV